MRPAGKLAVSGTIPAGIEKVPEVDQTGVSGGARKDGGGEREEEKREREIGTLRKRDTLHREKERKRKKERVGVGIRRIYYFKLLHEYSER